MKSLKRIMDKGDGSLAEILDECVCPDIVLNVDDNFLIIERMLEEIGRILWDKLYYHTVEHERFPNE